LPSFLVVLAANQASIAAALDHAGAVVQLELPDLPHLLAQIPAASGDPAALASLSQAASQICNGEGTERVASQMMKVHNEDHVAVQ
jgi:spore coat polysaccharide biosynthesis predicted glycosyltransferase SpsG